MREGGSGSGMSAKPGGAVAPIIPPGDYRLSRSAALLVGRRRVWRGALTRARVGHDRGRGGIASRSVRRGTCDQHHNDDRCDPGHAARMRPASPIGRSVRIVHSTSLHLGKISAPRGGAFLHPAQRERLRRFSPRASATAASVRFPRGLRTGI